MIKYNDLVAQKYKMPFDKAIKIKQFHYTSRNVNSTASKAGSMAGGAAGAAVGNIGGRLLGK